MRLHQHRHSTVRGAYTYRRVIDRHDRGIVLGILVIMAIGLAIVVAAQTADAAPSSHTSQTPSTDATSGSPAIHSLSANGNPITAADVVKYVQGAGMPRTLGPRNSITNIHAELLTSAQISANLHGESIGYPDSALLWFVQVQGSFVFPGPPGGHSVTAHTGYQIFDPTTGNLVMFGGLG